VRRTAIRAGFIPAFDGRGPRLLREGVVVIEGDHICDNQVPGAARGSAVPAAWS